jgi:acetylglutamate kinase
LGNWAGTCHEYLRVINDSNDIIYQLLIQEYIFILLINISTYSIEYQKCQIQYLSGGKTLVDRVRECGTIDSTYSTTAMSSPPLSTTSNSDKADILARALPYIRKFHGKTLVIKYGGNAMTDPQLQAGFAQDVVLLKLVGMNPVVVHGGGPQIENALQRLGKKGEFVQGMRVTDAETMEVVEWVLAGEVQQDIVGLINQAGGKAVGLTGRDGGMIRARQLKMQDATDPSKEVDVGQVGDIVSIDPSVVKALQDDAFIPVISPIGFGESNESYNINADLVASKLATVLKAEKLVLLTNTEGVLDKAGKLLRDLSARQIDALFADGTLSGGMLPKISGALDAAKSGVNSVHIIDGRVPHVLLLEILTEQAFGTLIRSH